MSYMSLYKIFVQSDSAHYDAIYKERYYSEASIKFPFQINSNPAFIFFHNDINKLLNKLKIMDKRVDNCFNDLPGVAQHHYIKKSLIDEILFTNDIEGVISTRKDIFEIIENINLKEKSKQRIMGITKKYEMLFENDVKIETVHDIRKLYDEMLYDEIKADNADNLPDGDLFRKNEVFIYSPSGKVIHTGVQSEEKIIDYLNEALKILNNEELDIYIRVAIFHYYFSYIHPFYDGNGRINRFIASQVLGNSCTPILSYRLSMTIKENLAQYYEAFKHTNDSRNKGDISTFVYEFLDIILKAYQKTELYALEKKKELDNYKKKIDTLNINDHEKNFLYILVQAVLFTKNGLTCSNLMEITSKGYRFVKARLTSLLEKELIVENKIGKYIYYRVELERF